MVWFPVASYTLVIFHRDQPFQFAACSSWKWFSHSLNRTLYQSFAVEDRVFVMEPDLWIFPYINIYIHMYISTIKGTFNFSSKRKYKKLEIDRYHEVNKNINKRKSIWEFLPHPRLYIFSIVVSMSKCHGIPQAKIPTGVILQKVVPSPLGIVATIMFRWRRQNFWMKRKFWILILNYLYWTSKVRGNLHQGSGHYLTF